MPMYPGQIDDNISMPSVIDNKTHLNADIYNRLRNAIIAVEQELGVKPSGIYTTVKSRIDNIENNNVYREVTHSPNNPTILTPTFVGERVLDSTHGFWYTALYNDSTSSRWSCDTVKSIRAQLSDGSITFDVTNFPALFNWTMDTEYIIQITGEANETFYVSDKSSSAFVVSSSNGSSTAWINVSVMRP